MDWLPEQDLIESMYALILQTSCPVVQDVIDVEKWDAEKPSVTLCMYLQLQMSNHLSDKLIGLEDQNI